MDKESPLNLSRFYILALLILAALLTASHALTQHSINSKKDDAKIINISGKQRMFSQNLGILVLEYAKANSETRRQAAKNKLEKNLHHMINAHHLLTGQPTNQKGYTEDLAHQRLSPRIHEMYFEEKHPYGDRTFMTLNEYVEHYAQEINAIMEIPVAELSTDHPKIRHIIEDYPHTLLRLLDNLVNQYEMESRQKNLALSQLTLGIYIFMLLAIIAMGLFIFRPMEKGAVSYAKKLQDLNEELEISRKREKMAALGELSGGLAHEINNTLQPVLGLSEVALKKLEKMEGADCEKVKSYISILRESALHARNIVENVLIFSRGEKIELSAHPAARFFNDCLELVGELIPSGIRLQKTGFETAETDDPAWIQIDKTKATQILVNLMKNSVQAMNGKGNITVTLSAKNISEKEARQNDINAGEHIILIIKDNGCGIAESELPNIFTPFYTTKDVEHGTGLGLSTVYGIMTDLNGTINVESTVGEGTTFYLYFPVFKEESTDQATENQCLEAHAL